jgi:nucleoside 2-deoxyribosyltransferase
MQGQMKRSSGNSEAIETLKQLARDPEAVSAYLSSQVRPEAVGNNARIGDLFEIENRFRVFLPHTISPTKSHEKIEEEVYRRCVEEIDSAKALLLLADSYGIDCGWEVGYAKGTAKPIIALIETEAGLNRLREDWMVKGAVDLVLVTKEELYEIAAEDPMIRNKRLLLVDDSDIPSVLDRL